MKGRIMSESYWMHTYHMTRGRGAARGDESTCWAASGSELLDFGAAAVNRARAEVSTMYRGIAGIIVSPCTVDAGYVCCVQMPSSGCRLRDTTRAARIQKQSGVVSHSLGYRRATEVDIRQNEMGADVFKAVKYIWQSILHSKQRTSLRNQHRLHQERYHGHITFRVLPSFPY